MRTRWTEANMAPRSLVIALALPMFACTGHIEELSGSGADPGSNGAGATGGSGSGKPGATSGSGGSTDPGAGGSAGSAVDPLAAACTPDAMLNVGHTPLRRLTRDQLNNVVHDLLGQDGSPADALAPDERIGPFESNAVAPITTLLVQQHHEVAASLAKLAEPRMKSIAPCDLAADTGTTCATQFVKDFGRRAYRRPLEAAEVQQYVSLYTLGKAESPTAGFRLVVEAMLQSPFVLYHHDVGSTGSPQPQPVQVTPYELAARLSFFLWNTLPDAALSADADSGKLTDTAVLSAHVERMVNDPHAAQTIGLFHQQWLGLDDLVGRDKNTTMFPNYSDQVAAAMLQETSLFTQQVISKGDGLLKTLLTSPMAFPQGAMFGIYGLTAPANYKVGTPVDLDATQRAGLLTQAAFLTRQSHADQTSPVHRGIIVRENLLCQIMPPPPAGVNTTPPSPTAITSTRERFAQHESNSTCAACHHLIDPIGLSFEHYDPIGHYRDKDGLGAVDATGEIANGEGALAGSFNGALELSAKLANAPEVLDCVANQWFRFSMGRMESTDDACSVKAIHDGFHTSGGNIRSLFAQIATSPAFRYVRINGG